MVSPVREQWSGRLEFILACMGYCLGLGNIWRFPFYCYISGGGVFLIPYVIMLVVAGMPIFYLELFLGQFTSEGPATAWRMAPVLTGIGWGMIVISAMTCVYYNVVVMYALYYFLVSLVHVGGEVPWASCGHTWNDQRLCREEALPDIDSLELDSEKIAAAKGLMDPNCVQTLTESLGPPSTSYQNFSAVYSDCKLAYTLPSQDYWSRFVLEVDSSPGIGHLGAVVSRNCLCLFFTWIIIFLCLSKGIKSVSKVVYFTATFPFVVMLIFLVRGFTQDGYQDGIRFYTSPDMGRFLDPQVWSTAASQVFYSLGPGFGGLLTLSSYNRFKHPVITDAAIVVVANSLTSIFGGLVTFSLLGTLAYETNRPMDTIVNSGPELLFVVYPAGLAKMPFTAIWSSLFFLMVITLGLDSQFMMMETVVSGLIDRFPEKLTKHRRLFLLTCCMVGFILGIPQTTQGGIRVMLLFDWYCASFGLLVIGILELLAVAWIYGVQRFIKDLELMVGSKSLVFWLYFILAWKFLTPLAILFIFVMFAIGYEATPYSDEVIPGWAEFFGWAMVAVPILCVLVRAIREVYVNRLQVSAAFKPKDTWGPRLPENRTAHYDNDEYFHPMWDTTVPTPPYAPSSCSRDDSSCNDDPYSRPISTQEISQRPGPPKTSDTAELPVMHYDQGNGYNSSTLTRR